MGGLSEARVRHQTALENWKWWPSTSRGYACCAMERMLIELMNGKLDVERRGHFAGAPQQLSYPS